MLISNKEAAAGSLFSNLDTTALIKSGNSEMEDIINDIDIIIREKYTTFTNMGVTNGLAGVSLYFYYHSLYTGTKDFSHALDFLGKAIDGLNEDYKGNNILGDIIEIGQLVSYYISKGVLLYEDIAFYYDNFDPILEDFLASQLQENNLNPVVGALKTSKYFLARKSQASSLPNKMPLYNVYSKIIANAVIKEGKVSWLSEIEREGQYVAELNITHGMAAIVNFLVDCYTMDISKEEVLHTINQALDTLLSCRNADGYPIFPFDMDNMVDRGTAHNLLYGDIGVGYTIYRSGRILNNPYLEGQGLDALTHAAVQREGMEIFVGDANLYYGCLGLASIFRFIYSQTGQELFHEAAGYWFARTNSQRKHSDEWAGFDSRNNKWDENIQMSFGHGLVGIGIAGMSHQNSLDCDFLQFINYTY